MIEKGQIVICDLELQYTRNGKIIKKILKNFLFSRDYDNDNFPNLDVIKNKRLINKLEKNKSHTIENLKVLSLNIILEPGFKHKY